MTLAEVTDACGDEPSWVCREVFELTDSSTIASAAGDAAAALGRSAVIVAVAAVVWVVMKRAITHTHDRIIARAHADDRVDGEEQRTIVRAETVSAALRAVSLIALLALVVLLILGEVGINLGPLIAGAGIVGIAVGFGAQSLIADLVAGIFMLMDDEYAVGDVVDLGDATGVVESFGLRTTRVRSLDGTLWTVRNGQITRTGNMTHRYARAVIDTSVAYGTDVRHASELIAGVATAMREEPEHAASFLEDPELLGVELLGADGITIRLRCMTPPGAQWALARELRTRIKEALEREGIEIPFPQRAVWIRRGDTSADHGSGAQPGAPTTADSGSTDRRWRSDGR